MGYVHSQGFSLSVMVTVDRYPHRIQHYLGDRPLGVFVGDYLDFIKELEKVHSRW